MKYEGSLDSAMNTHCEFTEFEKREKGESCM